MSWVLFATLVYIILSYCFNFLLISIIVPEFGMRERKNLLPLLYLSPITFPLFFIFHFFDLRDTIKKNKRMN